MEQIKWKYSYATGVEKIDNQHKNVINILNRLSDSVNHRDEKDTILLMLDDVYEFLSENFRMEEQIMLENRYMFYDKHRYEHVYFLNKILKFKIDFEDDGINFDEGKVEFLKKWLLNHFSGIDKKMGEYLALQGVALKI